MEAERFSRTEQLLGRDAMEKLRHAHVAVFGIGGVGGYIVEALVRSGVGSFTLIDHDKVSFSNINRQIIATQETVGRNKVDVMKERMLSINPDVKVAIHPFFYLPENADTLALDGFSYIADAVDTVTAKLELIVRAKEAGVPIISCMGTGNKLNPMQLEITDIYKTSVCPLAKVMRRELRKRGIEELKVLYSKEEPVKTHQSVPGSVSFVPPAAGMIIASEIIKNIAGVS